MLTPGGKAFSAVLVLKNFGSIDAKELKWKPSGCEAAILEAFLMQVAPYVKRCSQYSTIRLNVLQVAAFHALG
jgi:hypothetical protein